MTEYSSNNSRHNAGVPAADFVRRFGFWRDMATQAPVFVTNHGRATHVLMSRDHYADLEVRDDRAPCADPLDRSVLAMFDKLNECVMILGDDLTILRANLAACEFLAITREEAIGAKLEDALPTLRDSFAVNNLRRTLSTGEHLASDIQSVSRTGVWIHFESMRVPSGVAVKFRDITERVRADRLADVKQSIIRALEAEGTFGYARLSPREMVERADATLCDLTGLSADAMRRVRFSTMIPPENRAEFHISLEAVFSGEGTQQLESVLITNSGEKCPVAITLSEVRGEFVCEGAIALIRRL